MLKLYSLINPVLGIYLLLLVQCSLSKDNNCFKTVIVRTFSRDHPPDYRFNMTATPDGIIHTMSTVKRKIIKPMVKICIIQNDPNDVKVTLLNVTAKLCEFMRFINQVQMFKDIAKDSLRSSNFSFSCPLNEGVYILNNLRIKNRNPLMSFVYKPKRTVTFIGAMLEELPNKTLIHLSHCEIVLKVIKKSC